MNDFRPAIRRALNRSCKYNFLKTGHSDRKRREAALRELIQKHGTDRMKLIIEMKGRK